MQIINNPYDINCKKQLKNGFLKKNIPCPTIFKYSINISYHNTIFLCSKYYFIICN